MTRLTCMLPVLAAALGGCASHHALVPPVADMLRAGVVNDPKQVSRLEKAMTDHDIAKLLDVNVRAKLPSALAVAKLHSHCSGYQPYVARIDAEELATWQAGIEGQPLLRGVQPVSALAHADAKPTLHSLRVAAARMGCELLLVYLQSDSTVGNQRRAELVRTTPAAALEDLQTGTRRLMKQVIETAVAQR